MKIINTWEWWFLKGKERLKNNNESKNILWYEPKLCTWQCVINFHEVEGSSPIFNEKYRFKSDYLAIQKIQN